MLVNPAFGQFFKQKRMELGLTLREFCRKHDFNPGNISKLERGLHPPPQKESVRRRYAKALGIKEGTDDWLTFLDLATSCSGKLPPDVMNDERLIRALPLIFRSLSDTEVNEDKLRKLIDKIKKELS